MKILTDQLKIQLLEKSLLFICYICYIANIQQKINYIFKTHAMGIGAKIYKNSIESILFLKKIINIFGCLQMIAF